MHSKKKEELREILLPSESADEGKEKDSWGVKGSKLSIPKRRGPGIYQHQRKFTEDYKRRPCM